MIVELVYLCCKLLLHCCINSAIARAYQKFGWCFLVTFNFNGDLYVYYDTTDVHYNVKLSNNETDRHYFEFFGYFLIEVVLSYAGGADPVPLLSSGHVGSCKSCYNSIIFLLAVAIKFPLFFCLSAFSHCHASI